MTNDLRQYMAKSWWAAPKQLDDKNSLNNREVLLSLSKTFMLDVLEAFQKGLRGPQPESGQQATRNIEAVSTKYGKIFCGLDPAYKAVPGWSGEELAEFILSHGYARSEDATKSEPQRVLKSYFLYLAAEYCRTTKAHSEGEMTDGAYQAYINKTLTRMVNDLSGVITRG